MIVPATTDVIQEEGGKLGIPEIRVWVHPPEGGDDYYNVFDNFKDAIKFADEDDDAESNPLIAFKGYELNLWEMKPQLTKKGKK